MAMNTSNDKVCRYCGTLTHIPGSPWTSYPIERKETHAHGWHASAACVVGEDGN